MLVVSCLVLRKGTVGVLCETVGLLGRFQASYLYFLLKEMYPGYLFAIAQTVQLGSIVRRKRKKGANVLQTRGSKQQFVHVHGLL
jgi:hypothetical protein